MLERQNKGDLVEAFGTGTAAVISPVGEFCYDNQCFTVNNKEVGPLSQQIYKSITDIHYGRIKDTFGWMKPLETL